MGDRRARGVSGHGGGISSRPILGLAPILPATRPVGASLGPVGASLGPVGASLEPTCTLGNKTIDSALMRAVLHEMTHKSTCVAAYQGGDCVCQIDLATDLHRLISA